MLTVAPVTISALIRINKEFKMKIFIFVLLLVGASFAWENAWQSFKLKHGKKYASLSEEKHRFAIFKKALKKIANHNQLFRAGKVSWKQGITPFSDRTPEEFISFLNQSGSLSKPQKAVPFVGNTCEKVPDKINWRSLGKVSRVKDQKSCGSCWAFSTTGAIESQLLIKGKNYSLSEQQLVDCSIFNFGCGGGWVDESFDYIQRYGIEHEEFYPYTARNGVCRYNKSKIATRVQGYYEGRNETDLKKFVGLIGPTSVYIDASHFQYYKSGIFDTEFCSKRSNHAVLVVGYDKENGKDYWLVKNSWGDRWGDEGYVKMARGKKLCNIGAYDYIPYI